MKHRHSTTGFAVGRLIVLTMLSLALLTPPAFAAALLTGTKTVSGTFTPGGVITYTVTLTNNGTDPQSDNAGNEFTDVLPASLALISAIASSGIATANAVPNMVTWNGSLAPLGGSVTITVTATIGASTAGGTVVSNQGAISYDGNNDNVNEASAVTDDPGTGGANDPTSFTVSSAIISGTKTVSGTFTPGSPVTYTVTLNNSGDLAAGDNAGNEFTDVLPAAALLVSANSSSGTTLASIGLNTVTWNGSIPASGSVTITITATIAGATAAGTVVSNQGSISFDGNNDGSNESSAVTDNPGTGAANDPTAFTVIGPAAVSGTKTVSGTFTPGSTVTYTVTLTNTGDVAQGNNPGNEFSDVLPAALLLVSANSSSGIAATNAGLNTVTWNGSIPAGGSVTITITATIVGSTAGGTAVSNQGSISFDADNNGTNESSRVTDNPGTGAANDPTVFTVIAPATVSGTKTVSGTFTPGSPITYTVTLTNTGGIAQGNNPGDEFADILPASLVLVSANATSGTAVASSGSNSVIWDGSIANGGSVTITIAATIAASAVPSTVVSNQGFINFDVDNNGTNESSAVTDDPGTAAAADPTGFTVIAPANVPGTKTVSGTFSPGGTITYVVVLTNSGGIAQGNNPGNEFTDILPASLLLVSANATSGTAVSNVGLNTVTWNGSLPASASVTITITATIAGATAPGTVVSNQGNISYDADGNGVNESSRVTDDPGTGAANDPTVFTVIAPASVSGTKTVIGTFNPSGAITYTVVLTNGGGIAQGNNPGNEFTDILPASLLLVGANATSGTAVATVGLNTVTWNGSLAASASVTITITATIAGATAPATVVSNQGSISFDADNNGTNESSRVTDNPGTGAANDPTVFTVIAPATVSGTKTVSGTFNPGGAITYTVVLTNGGGIAQGNNPGNEFIDILPASLLLVGANATSGIAVANVGLNTVTWNGSLAASASVTITITATIAGSTAGGTTVTNQGTVSFDADGNGTNESAAFTDDPGVPGTANPTSFTVIAPAPPPPPPPPPSPSPSPNQAPTLGGVTDAAILETTPLTLTLTVGDDATPAADLVVTASSSNTALLPNAALVFGGAGGTRTLTLTPIMEATGQTTLTVTVSDGALSTIRTALITVVVAPPPQPPTGLTGSSLGTEVTLTWVEPATGATPTFYVLEGGSAPGLTTLPVIVTPTRVARWTLQLPAGVYFFRARAANRAGTSDRSNEATVVVSSSSPLPGAPTGLAAVVDGLHVTLSWQPSILGGAPAGWQLELGAAAGASDLGVFGLAPEVTAVGGDLAAGEYFARVRGVNGAGPGPVSNETRFRVGEVPACDAPRAPVLLPATINGGLVTLSWRAPRSAAVGNYRLLVGSIAGGSDLAIFDVGPVTSFVAQAPPGRYHVAIVATNACGSSTPSNSIEVVVGSTDVPPAPANLRATVNGSQVSLAWDAAAGATSYRLEAGFAPGSTTPPASRSRGPGSASPACRAAPTTCTCTRSAPAARARRRRTLW